MGGLGNQLFQIFNLISYCLTHKLAFHFEPQKQKINILLKLQRMLLLDTIALLIPKKEVRFIRKKSIMGFLN